MELDVDELGQLVVGPDRALEIAARQEQLDDVSLRDQYSTSSTNIVRISEREQTWTPGEPRWRT